MSSSWYTITGAFSKVVSRLNHGFKISFKRFLERSFFLLFLTSAPNVNDDDLPIRVSLAIASNRSYGRTVITTFRLKYLLVICNERQDSPAPWSIGFYYTRRLWRVGCNSFGIVCVSVSVSVTTLMAKRTDIQTWISACRSSGRISRSSLKVKVIGQRSRSLGQKTSFRVTNSVWNWIHSTPYMNGRATTWGVFKAYAFFLHYKVITFLDIQKKWLDSAKSTCPSHNWWI